MIKDEAYEFKVMVLSAISKNFKKLEEIFMELKETNLFGQNKDGKDSFAEMVKSERAGTRQDPIDDKRELLIGMDCVIRFLTPETVSKNWRDQVLEGDEDYLRFDRLARSEERFVKAIALFREAMNGELSPNRIDSTKESLHALNGMDYIIRRLNDETKIDSWLSNGVPDGSDWGDLQEIIEDSELFEDIVNLFIRYAKRGFDELFAGGKVY